MHFSLNFILIHCHAGYFIVKGRYGYLHFLASRAILSSGKRQIFLAVSRDVEFPAFPIWSILANTFLHTTKKPYTLPLMVDKVSFTIIFKGKAAHLSRYSCISAFLSSRK